MKILAWSALALFCALPLRADTLLQNGDFSDGLSHWHGDMKAPSDFAPDNPMDKPDPFTSKGLIIALKHSSWCKVDQDFKGKISSGILTITYMISPDFAFSTNAEDYVNMPDKIGYDAWLAFNSKPGSWIIFLSDFGTDVPHATYYQIAPKTGSSEPQVYRARVSGLTPLESKTLTLAFPPGEGKLVILNVSLDPSEAAASSGPP